MIPHAWFHQKQLWDCITLENFILHFRFIYKLLIALLPVACSPSNTAAPENSNTQLPELAYPIKGIIHWSPFKIWDNETIAEAARANMAIFPLGRCVSEDGSETIRSLKLLNPSIQIIGYQPLLNVCMLVPDTTYLRQKIPYDLDYYYSVQEHWAYTTTGDTLMIWKDMIYINPIKNGQIKRELIVTIVDLITRYQIQSDHMLDGIMHDYFMYSIYINPSIEHMVDGEIDLDGDGVLLNDDDNEKALLYLWQVEYAREFRKRFGRDFIQIGNGYPPQVDSELAGLLNGIFYEHFPTSPWHFSEIEGLTRLFEHQQEGYLSTAKGRTWNIVSNATYEQNNLFCLISSMLAGCFYAELYGSYKFNGWSLEIDSGQPTGPTIIETTEGSTIVKRMFEKGEAYISFTPSGIRDNLQFVPIESEE